MVNHVYLTDVYHQSMSDIEDNRQMIIPDIAAGINMVL